MLHNFSRQAKFLACLFLFLGNIAPTLDAQPKRFRPQPNYAQLSKPDQAEGRRILKELRQSGPPGDYYWEFNLRIMPRRGDERTVTGRLWGSRNERGPLTRIELATSSSPRLLIQNGNPPSLWSYTPETQLTQQQNTALFTRLADTELTPFDLQMPYLYWDEFIFEGIVKHLNRPAQSFLLYPPTDIAAARPDLTGIRLIIDSQFRAPVQIQEIGTGNKTIKTITVNDLSKIDDQWIVKSIDIRDDTTRNKTRFHVRAATMRIDLSPALFAPAELATAINPPASHTLRQIAP